MKISGIGEIEIERMEGHIPLIKAKSQQDMAFGLGYCHALDRGMQMMLMKILGLGKASECLNGSEEMLEIDKFFRRMNWHNNLAEEIRKLNKADDALFEAYCDGVNAAFSRKQPWELKYLLGFKDFRWTKDDTILLARMTGFLTLAQSQGEVERLFLQMVQKGISRKLLDELFPDLLGSYDENLLKKITLNEKIVPDEVKWNLMGTAFMASNNWAISGQRTQSGSPILASDPHLEINRLPAVWYEAAARVGDRFVHGATMPGLPSFIIGRTNHLAWGVTYAYMDATDSWIEHCKDGHYLKDGQWHPFSIRKEVIRRKNADPVEVVFYENEHGVLDGDPFEDGYYISTKWSADTSGASTLSSGFKVYQVEHVEEGMAAVGKIETAFSWVLADTHGNIGFQMSGLMPKRKPGNSGFVPVPGWLSENDWQGFYQPEELPRLYNPEEGFVITANNDLNNLGKVHPINMPMGAYRSERIKQLIEREDRHDTTYAQEMQYDTYSLQAEQFMKIIRPLLPDTDNGNLLREWDLCYDVDSKGAFLFEMIYRSLYQKVFGGVLGRDLLDFLPEETGIFIDFYRNFDAVLLAEESTWFLGKARDDLYREAIVSALKVKARSWGEFNQITLTHIILGNKLPKFLGFDKGPIPLPGGRASIHQGQIYTTAGRKSSFGPSFRLVTDLAERSSFSNYIGGVSDRRFSKWYTNEILNWINGRYKKIDF